MKKRHIVIIGGGAAGYFAAICAKEADRNVEVTILEKSVRVLVKVGVSGGGRCNVTHQCLEPRELVKKYPRGGRELLGPFHTFGPAEMIAWLEGRGVGLKVEADGRMFPVTDDSGTIIACLLKRAEVLGVVMRPKKGAERIEKLPSGQFAVHLKDEDAWVECDRVLIATGGGKVNAGVEMARELGHAVVDPVPSLFTFNIEDARLADLAGISFENAEVAVVGEKKLKERGPLIITHWGLSGPGVLKLSAWGARELYQKDYNFEIRVNFLPGRKSGEILEILQGLRKGELREKEVGKWSQFGISKRFWERVVVAAGIAEGTKWKQVNEKQLGALVRELVEGVYRVEGKSTFKDEFVTAGGVALKDVNFKTMESKLVPGLYFAGEVLDIDGVTGGFNFQAAWTAAYIAGGAMVES